MSRSSCAELEAAPQPALGRYGEFEGASLLRVGPEQGRGRFQGAITPSPVECRSLRHRLRWSCERLAEEAGLTKKTVVDFESGVRTPQARTLIAIRGAFRRAGVPVDGPVSLSGER